jgi:hypothetical protein
MSISTRSSPTTGNRYSSVCPCDVVSLIELFCFFFRLLKPRTALMVAVQQQWTEAVESLLECKQVDVNLGDPVLVCLILAFDLASPSQFFFFGSGLHCPHARCFALSPAGDDEALAGCWRGCQPKKQ